MKKKTYYVNSEVIGLKNWSGVKKKVFVSDFYEEGDVQVYLKDACFFSATSDPGIKMVNLEDIIFMEDN